MLSTIFGVVFIIVWFTLAIAARIAVIDSLLKPIDGTPEHFENRLEKIFITTLWILMFLLCTVAGIMSIDMVSDNGRLYREAQELTAEDARVVAIGPEMWAESGYGGDEKLRFYTTQLTIDGQLKGSVIRCILKKDTSPLTFTKCEVLD